jgi:hypothetical protein
MKRFLPLVMIPAALAAEEETPIYPCGLELENDTTLEEVGSLLRADGWETETSDDELCLLAERADAELVCCWLDENYLEEVTYTELWEDGWAGKDRYGEWLEWLTLIHEKPMVDDETFHYWNLPGMEVWIEITEGTGGAATLTYSLTFL